MPTESAGGWQHGQQTHAMLTLSNDQLQGLARHDRTEPIVLMPLAGYVHGLHAQDLLYRDPAGEWYRLPYAGEPYAAPASDVEHIRDRWLRALLDAGPWVTRDMPELEDLLWWAAGDQSWWDQGPAGTTDRLGWAVRIGRFILTESDQGQREVEAHGSDDEAERAFDSLAAVLEPPEPDAEDYVITNPAQGPVHVGTPGGGHIGRFASHEAAVDAVVQRMDRDSFWPDVWVCNERGSTELIPPAELVLARARVGGLRSPQGTEQGS